MSYTRRIVHFSPGPTDFVSVISDRAIAGCWFELHRQGGCGAGELRLKDEFPQRNAIDVGDWIAFEFTTGDRWYLGRVEHRQAKSPAGLTFRLEGMGVELGEAFPGGFNPSGGTPPHRYANTDLFSNDPDRSLETFDSVDEPHELVDLLLLQYVVPQTHITRDPALIEASIPVSTITSLKFRGEESVRSIIKELAVRSRNASWGVDADGKFFFLRQRAGVIATFQEGVDVVSLEELRDRNLLYNRIVLTGGYVYDQRINSDDIARRVYRWRGNYTQPASRAQYGQRRIRLWVPWIRTQDDSRSFTREFFRTYANPPTRFLVEVANLQALPRPWDGPVRLLARDGSELALMLIETVRIQFDHAPRLKMEVGAEDPLALWPEPPHDERWEIPDNVPQGGDSITLTETLSSLSSGTSSVTSSSLVTSSLISSGTSSLISSGTSSLISSGISSLTSSALTSSGLSSAASSGPPTSSSSTPPVSSSSGPPVSTGISSVVSSSSILSSLVSSGNSSLVSSGISSLLSSAGMSSGLSSAASSGPPVSSSSGAPVSSSSNPPASSSAGPPPSSSAGPPPSSSAGPPPGSSSGPPPGSSSGLPPSSSSSPPQSSSSFSP